MTWVKRVVEILLLFVVRTRATKPVARNPLDRLEDECRLRAEAIAVRHIAEYRAVSHQMGGAESPR